jgi:uncharacterized delta-60 repeat protein
MTPDPTPRQALCLVVFLISSLGLVPVHAVDPRGSLALLDPDPTFAGDGTLEYAADVVSYAWYGNVEASGEIMVIGYSDNGNPVNGTGIFQRILADGSPGAVERFPHQAFACAAPRFWLAGIRLSTGFYAGGGYNQRGCGGVPRDFDVIMWNPTTDARTFFEDYEFFNQLAYVQALAEQDDGKIVGAGFATTNQSDPETFQFAVARWNADGTKDLSFGTNGEFTFDYDGDQDIINDLLIDSQQRIVLVGSGISSVTGRDFLVLRLTPQGQIDPTFADNGLLAFDHLGFSDGATSIEAARGDRLVIGGSRGTADGEFEPVVIRLLPNGQFDNGFGSSGQAVLDFGSSFSTITDIELGAGNQIYVTGVTWTGSTENQNADGVVTVLRSHGVPDTRFNGGAARIFSFGDDASALPGDFPRNVALSPLDDRIVITGHTRGEVSTENRIGVARFIGLDPQIFSDRLEE